LTTIKEDFSEGTSVIHRLDPRVKLVVAGLFSAVVAMARSPVAVWLSLLLAVLWLGLAHLNLKKVGTRLLMVNGFIFFLWLILPFTFPGQPAFMVGPLTASRQGLELAGLLTLKSNTILLALISLVTTISIPTLGQALHHLRLPHKLCYLMLFTYRYLYVFEQEYHRLRQAIKVRGFRPRTNLHTYRTYAYLVAMLLVRSHDRAERVFQAMRCRGFKGKFYSLHQFSWHRRDLVFLVSMLPCIMTFLWLDYCFPR